MTNYEEYSFFNYKDKRHMYILSLLHKIKWVIRYKTGIYPDKMAFARWLSMRSTIKKPLDKCDIVETKMVMNEFETIVKNQFIKKILELQ